MSKNEIPIKKYIRGHIESILDEYEEEEVIADALSRFSNFKPAVKNLGDTYFGFIIGEMLQKHRAMFNTMLGRVPNEEEISSLNDLLKRRAIRLSSKIRSVMMK